MSNFRMRCVDSALTLPESAPFAGSSLNRCIPRAARPKNHSVSEMVLGPAAVAASLVVGLPGAYAPTQSRIHRGCRRGWCAPGPFYGSNGTSPRARRFDRKHARQARQQGRTAAGASDVAKRRSRRSSLSRFHTLRRSALMKASGGPGEYAGLFRDAGWGCRWSGSHAGRCLVGQRRHRPRDSVGFDFRAEFRKVGEEGMKKFVITVAGAALIAARSGAKRTKERSGSSMM